GNNTVDTYGLISILIHPARAPGPRPADDSDTDPILAGEITAPSRGKKKIDPYGNPVNIPATAPHSFTNASKQSVRLLCICAPAGLEEFFAQVGVAVATRTTPPPKLDKRAQAEFIKKAQELAPKYRTELLKP